MALFGEKCVRCGQRTKHEHEGAPVCESCTKEMELAIEADSEAERLCPIDKVPMKKEIAHMIIIDRCPNCQGVWLDAGELDLIKGGVEAKTLSAVVVGFTYPLA